MKAEFKVKQRAIVQTIVAIAVSLIIIGMVTAIGLAIMAQASVSAQTQVNTLPTATQTDANAALKIGFTNVNTISGYYPLLFLALIGGVALSAFVGFMALGRGNGGSAGAM